MSGSSQRTGVIPARLAFLAIYNPFLGHSEESLHEQIVYYYSEASGRWGGRDQSGRSQDEKDTEEKNERLRQIGLAQGMVEFAKYCNSGPGTTDTSL